MVATWENSVCVTSQTNKGSNSFWYLNSALTMLTFFNVDVFYEKMGILIVFPTSMLEEFRRDKKKSTTISAKF